jgi:hypothetical protein
MLISVTSYKIRTDFMKICSLHEGIMFCLEVTLARHKMLLEHVMQEINYVNLKPGGYIN